MRIVKVDLANLSSTSLDLGFAGEVDHTKVEINCASFFANYPDATASMVAKPPVGDLYPVTLTKSNCSLIWAVSESDISYAGSGQFQITFTDSGEVIKTALGNYSVKPSLNATGDPPTPLEDWLEEAQEALDDFEQDVSDAEAWAAGTRGGVAVESTDPAYHNNAKYWADHLNISVSGTTLILNA